MMGMIEFVERRPVSAIFIGIFLIAGLIVVIVYVATAGSIATAPGRVISKTLETDNIIHSYEWFYDVHAAYLSRVGQIREFKKLDRAEDAAEAARERVELSAIRQTCRDLATKYNADSQKMNKSIFRGWSLPEALDMGTCE
jgi:hypothetical protein